MNEAAKPRAMSAGGLIRQARQAQGLHIGALAASIKISQRKLELLEADRFDQLPDVTFTRALAQSLCRTLKIDAAPVLELLPTAVTHRLEHLSEGLNTPFAEGPGRLVPKEWANVAMPAVWIAGFLVLLAVGVYFMPAGWLPAAKMAKLRASAASQALPAARAASEAAVTSNTTTETVSLPMPAAAVPSAADASAVAAPASAASAAVEVSSASSPAVAAASLVQLRTTEASWVDATDARGQTVLSRIVQPGEMVPIDAPLPVRLKIGNASAAQVHFRGQPLPLAPYTRDNVARLELK